MVNTLFRESFCTKERSTNITQTNDENRDQSNDQNVLCDICARTFRTNRGFLQHFVDEEIDIKETIQMEIYRQTTTMIT